MKNPLLLILLLLLSNVALATPSLKQSQYRWRNNNGNETSATWKAAGNTAITHTTLNDTIRFRAEYLSLDAFLNITASDLGHFLSYSKDNGATWVEINETATNDFMLVSSTIVTHGSNTTNQMAAGTAGTFTPGKIISQNTPSMAMSLASSNRTEMEWVIKGTYFTENNTTYLFENRSITTTGVRGQLTTNFNCTMPVLTLPPSIERCGPGTVTLAGNLNTSGGTIIWRTAPTGGTILGIGQSITSPPYTASTTVYAKGTKDGCTTASQAVNIVIKEYPVVNLGQDLDTCIFADQPVTLNAGPQPTGTTFNWEDNSTAAQRQINQSGTYAVRVTSPNGCQTDDTINITMREKPVVDLSRNGNGLCIGISKILDAGPGGQNGGSYYWNNGAQTQTINVNAPGTYITQVTASNNCSTSDTIEIIANGFAPSVSGLQAMAQGGSKFKFTAVNPEHVVSYSWDFGDGSALSSDPNPTYTYASNGIFNARLKLSSTCADVWDSIQVNIFGVGINDPKADSRLFNVYPNPNRDGNLNIEVLGDAKIEDIMVVNLSGQEIGRFEINKGQDKYKISLPASLSGGIYQLVIKTDKGLVVKKINLIR